MKAVVAALLALSLPGCWYLRQGAGQIDLLIHSRSLEEVAADPLLPAHHRRKLLLIREVKAFGELRMGLAPSGNYTKFYDTGGEAVTWIVSACAKDRFESYTWSFPIVGAVPYKGYFDRADALAEARALEVEGYDVSVGPAAAYSTLGYFNDPVLSTMLSYPEEDLAALILHELTHGTLYLPGGTEFNEGLASFVGTQGALEFFRLRRGEDSTSYARAVRSLAREERRDARAKELYAKLDALYRSELSREEKVRRRDGIAGELRAGWKREAEALLRTAEEARRVEDLLEERVRRRACPTALRPGDLQTALERLAALPGVAEGPVNNAAVLAQRRYGRYDEFRARFEAVGGDWPAFFASMRATSPSASAGSAPTPP